MEHLPSFIFLISEKLLARKFAFLQIFLFPSQVWQDGCEEGGPLGVPMNMLWPSRITPAPQILNFVTVLSLSHFVVMWHSLQNLHCRYICKYSSLLDVILCTHPIFVGWKVPMSWKSHAKLCNVYIYAEYFDLQRLQKIHPRTNTALSFCLLIQEDFWPFFSFFVKKCIMF